MWPGNSIAMNNKICTCLPSPPPTLLRAPHGKVVPDGPIEELRVLTQPHNYPPKVLLPHVPHVRACPKFVATSTSTRQ